MPLRIADEVNGFPPDDVVLSGLGWTPDGSYRCLRIRKYPWSLPLLGPTSVTRIRYSAETWTSADGVPTPDAGTSSSLTVAVQAPTVDGVSISDDGLRAGATVTLYANDPTGAYHVEVEAFLHQPMEM